MDTIGAEREKILKEATVLLKEAEDFLESAESNMTVSTYRSYSMLCFMEYDVWDKGYGNKS